MDFYLNFPEQKITLKSVAANSVDPEYRTPFALPGIRMINNSKLISQKVIGQEVHFWFHDFLIQEIISVYLATKKQTHTLLLVQTNNPVAIIDSQFPLIEGKSYLFYIPSDHPYSLKLEPGDYHFFQMELSINLMDKMAGNNIPLQAMLKKIRQHPLEELLYHSGFVDVRMQHVLRELREYLPADATERLFFLEEKTLQLMRYFSQQWTEEQTESQLMHQKEQVMIDIGKYIQAHLDSPLNSSFLAHQFHLSERSLYQQFKVFHGLTVYRFILKERMGYAAFLLTQGYLNTNEVASRTGFQDASAFRRAFKKYFKSSPSEFIQNKGKK